MPRRAEISAQDNSRSTHPQPQLTAYRRTWRYRTAFLSQMTARTRAGGGGDKRSQNTKREDRWVDDEGACTRVAGHFAQCCWRIGAPFRLRGWSRRS
eukprot:2515088-Prymnesium_polylepis.2